MATWAITGVVEDSEEEDESPIELIRYVKPYGEISSAESSPLSSLPSTPSNWPSSQTQIETLADNEIRGVNRNESKLTDNNAEITANSDVASLSGVLAEITDNQPTHQRHFRKRAPIQIHPYVLEQQLHARQFLSKGLKALTYAGDPSQESQADPTLSYEEVESQQQPRKSPVRRTVASTLPSYSSSGSKRRRIQRNTPPSSPVRATIFDLPLEDWSQPSQATSAAPEALRLSPKPSNIRTIQQDEIPTTIRHNISLFASDDEAGTMASDVEDIADAEPVTHIEDGDEEFLPRSLGDDASMHSESREESDSELAREASRWARQLKGVLPASFSTLNIAKKAGQKSRIPNRPQQQDSRKGQARRKGKVQHTAAEVLLWEDEETSEDEPRSKRPPSFVQETLDANLTLIDLDDIEDNSSTVDRMLPAYPKQKSSTATKHKKPKNLWQSRLNQAVDTTKYRSRQTEESDRRIDKPVRSDAQAALKPNSSSKRKPASHSDQRTKAAPKKRQTRLNRAIHAVRKPAVERARQTTSKNRPKPQGVFSIRQVQQGGKFAARPARPAQLEAVVELSNRLSPVRYEPVVRVQRNSVEPLSKQSPEKRQRLTKPTTLHVPTPEQTTLATADVISSLEFGESLGFHKESPEYFKEVSSYLFTQYSQGGAGMQKIEAEIRFLTIQAHAQITSWTVDERESIVKHFFDFFALGKLSPFLYERWNVEYGFLSSLGSSPDLSIQTDDMCFQVFLKMMGRGLKNAYQGREKHFRNLIFRLMPNHGRDYPKAEVLKYKDLVSLQNHHSLLCTLYWMAPPACRPPLRRIQDLVNPEIGHIEASKINIEAWSCLVQFQLSSCDPDPGLIGLQSWFSEFVDALLRQRHSARTDTQAGLQAKEKEGFVVDRRLFERTVRKNQEKVEILLQDSVEYAKAAIAACQTVSSARSIFSPWAKSLLDLPAAEAPRTQALVQAVLDSVLAYIHASQPRLERAAPRIDNSQPDSSQDYGDSFDLEEGLAQTDLLKNAELMDELLQDSLSRIVSNCIGADALDNDTFVRAAIKTWVAAFALYVQGGIRTWDSVVSSIQRSWWSVLRDTPQKRLYEDLFWAEIVDAHGIGLDQIRSELVRWWAASIVLPPARLGFQHLLTGAILNRDVDEPLLDDFPFLRCDGRYQISLGDFLTRRTATISTLFHNMHKHSQDRQLRQHSADILDAIMREMKAAFLATAPGSNERKGYASFIHSIVDLMHEYTTTIRKVDSFFTETADFPLPSADPDYVVGRLRSYGPRLSERSGQETLITFMAAMTKRAVLGHRGAGEDYLVAQLSSVVCDFSSSTGASLRAFLMDAVFPSYWETAALHPQGYVVARPILKASDALVSSLFLNLNACDEASLAEMLELVSPLFLSLRLAVEPIVDGPALLESSAAFALLVCIFRIVRSAAPLVDYLSRTTQSQPMSRSVSELSSTTVRNLWFFYRFSLYLTSFFHAGNAPEDPRIDPHDPLHLYTTELSESTAKTSMAIRIRELLADPQIATILPRRTAATETDQETLWAELRAFHDELGRLSWIRPTKPRSHAPQDPFKDIF